MSQQPSQDQIVKISESIPLSTSNIIAPQNIDEAKKSFKKSSSTNKFLAVVLKCCMAINPFKPKMNLLGPKPEEYAKRKTLVLDIDETLVHTTLGKKDNSDIYLGSSDGLEDMGVVKRPFVDEFLEKVGQMFEVVIFTAGISIYGKAIVSKLDQTKTVYKTLSREHCTYMNGVYVKNLARLGRDLKDIILVDNSANSFLMQPDNAYHIPSFFDDKADRELEKLLPFLEYLAKVDDVRPVRGLFQKYESGGICRENQLLKTVEQTADNIDAKAQNDSESNKTGNGQEIPITEPQSLYIAGKGISRESVHSGPETHNFHQKDMEADMLEDMEVAPKELNPLIHKKSRQKTAFVAKSSHQENVADFKKHRSLAKLDTERSALKEEEEEDNGKEIKNLEVEDLEGVDQRYKYYPRGDANSPVLGLGGILESNETRSSLFQVRAL